MLQDSKELQQKKVGELFRKAHEEKTELTFRAPTGSGKTWMMADFMNRILAEQHNIVFIVSTLSKGNLAQQNYDSFVTNVRNGNFPNLKPYLINSDASSEEDVYIPTDYNVYVLPRDLYKEGSILKRGAMQNFLRKMKYGDYLEHIPGKEIYLIKDECHVATTNLDNEKEYWSRIFNFSATPKLGRGQTPDVEMTDEEAQDARLIKEVILNEDIEATVEDALDKFIEIKSQYDNLLDVHPCLIIQISNKDKAEEEWTQKIRPALDKHQALKWMLIVDAYKKTGEEDKKKYLECDTNDSVKKKLPPSKWKDYAKERHSTIDVIIFKMVISEGWDIPRACMLFQVRDTTSIQLDEQVMGRVRRNPRLLDYETLSPEAQQLATTAWVWGIRPKEMKKTIPVRLYKEGDMGVRTQIQVWTTRLLELTERSDFDIHTYMKEQKMPPSNEDIFTLYRKMQQGDEGLTNVCYDYAGENYYKWWHFMETYDKVKKVYDTFKVDYEKSMVKNIETSFPVASAYIDDETHSDIETWVWRRHDIKSDKFSFDSEAEGEWAMVLEKLSLRSQGIAELEQKESKEEIYLWGKNFPKNSDICYQYYSNGIHKSYPDFILKDKAGRIHVMEVKCLNGSGKAGFNPEDYLEKVEKLKECYKYCSQKLENHVFHVPIKTGDEWDIWTYQNGVEDKLTKDQFKASLTH